jgi:SPASM domain peptide maturase of grasp-with-spasm system
MIKKAEFKLFSNCIPVKGAKRSTICDLQRNEVHFLPNSFVELLNNGIIYDDSNLNDETRACVSYLIENDLGHFIVDPESFPDLALDYEFPGHATHSIIEISDNSKFKFSQIFSDLSNLGVKFIELRIMRQIEPGLLNLILEKLKPTRIIDITLFLRFSDLWSNTRITELLVNFQRISAISLFSSTKDGVENIIGRKLTHTKKELNSKCCGKVHTSCFSCNIRTFSESQKLNTCLHGKVSITGEGLIKNCPSLKETYGNLSDTTLKQVVMSEPFQKLWNISKDKIRVCRDCEFRHVCTDCRAYLEDPNDLYSKPLKCGYDPYTGNWEEWSSSPLKKAAIDHYDLEGYF